MIPRQSVYFNPSASANQVQKVHACTDGLQRCSETLRATNGELERFTGDFARLSKALSNQRHFDLVSETDVKHAREHVAAEIAPLLRELIVRAEDALARDEQTARSLRTKATEVLTELDTPSKPKTSPSILDTTTPGSSVASIVAQTELDEHRRQLAELQQERKRLADRVAALERRDGRTQASSTKPAQETPRK